MTASPVGKVGPIGKMLLTSHLLAPHDLPGHLAHYAAEAGFANAELYLADLQQKVLVPFLEAGQPDADHQASVLGIDSTLAGRVFQSLQPLGQDDGHGAVRTWVPVINGMQRLGVMGVNIDVSSEADEDATRRALALLAEVVGELVTTKTAYSDTLVRLRRTAPMGLAAELQWGLLPPLTFADANVSIAALLEPAYEVAGDSVDYGVDHDTARFAIFDGMGHGLLSAQAVTLVVGAYRNARAANHSLGETCARIDDAVESMYDECFVTGVLGELDNATGVFTWVTVGHPPPLLMRDGQVVKVLESDPQLPFGTGLGDHPAATTPGGPSWRRHLGSEQLQPGDQILLYTDGVVEARSPNGIEFGVERLTNLIDKGLAAQVPVSETLRRVVRALLQHHGTQLVGDASLLLAPLAAA